MEIAANLDLFSVPFQLQILLEKNVNLITLKSIILLLHQKRSFFSIISNEKCVWLISQKDR